MSEDPPLLYAADLRRLCGVVQHTGTYQFTEQDIRSFAQQWDPLPMHIDDGAHFGALIASGVHTFAVFQRLAATSVYSRWAVFAGRAIRNLELTRPAYAGDALSGDLSVRSVGPDRNGRARATIDGHLHNQHDELVLAVEIDCYVHTEPGATARTPLSGQSQPVQ